MIYNGLYNKVFQNVFKIFFIKQMEQKINKNILMLQKNYYFYVKNKMKMATENGI